MSNCRYCHHLEPAATTPAITWEKIHWVCAKDRTVVDGEHNCPDYEREVGSDDDIGDESHGDAISGDFGDGEWW